MRRVTRVTGVIRVTRFGVLESVLGAEHYVAGLDDNDYLGSDREAEFFGGFLGDRGGDGVATG